MSSAQIGENSHVGITTVKIHVVNLMTKTRCDNVRVSLSGWAWPTPFDQCANGAADCADRHGRLRRPGEQIIPVSTMSPDARRTIATIGFCLPAGGPSPTTHGAGLCHYHAMSQSTGTIITVAPTGAEHAKSDVPNLPVTLDELVRTAQDCERVGASMIHVHIRDDAAQPTLDLVRLKDTVAALHEQTNLIVQLSTGGAVTDPESDRLRVLDALPDSASCTMGTVNFGDDVFMNRWEFIVELHQRMAERGIVPEYEIFDLGQLSSLHRLLDKHGPPAGGHVHVDLVMGVPGGMSGDTETLAAAMRLVPTGASFSATGVGRASLPVMFASLSAGGHLRVGMEDTITYARGERVKDNAQLVARAAGLARIAQRPPMAAGQVRELLGVKGEKGLADVAV
jgi:3-keto-5-aminohexanoate cleavage enzyme